MPDDRAVDPDDEVSGLRHQLIVLTFLVDQLVGWNSQQIEALRPRLQWSSGPQGFTQKGYYGHLDYESHHPWWEESFNYGYQGWQPRAYVQEYIMPHLSIHAQFSSLGKTLKALIMELADNTFEFQ